MSTTQLLTDSKLTSTHSDEFKRRVSIIRQNIYGAFLSSGNTYRLSFYQLINRLCVLVQLPIYTVLYKKEKKGYKRVESTLAKDVINRNGIVSQCKELYSLEEVTVATKSQIGDFFRVFGTSFYIIVFYIDGYDRNNSNKPILVRIRLKEKDSNESISSNIDYIYYSIRNVLFSNIESKNEKYKVPDAFKKYINKSISNIQYSYVKDKLSKTKIINRDSISLGDNICSNIFERFSESIKLASSICLSKNYDGPPNMMVFCRDYDTENQARCGIYPYNLNVISCTSQDEVIIKSMKKLFSDERVFTGNNSYINFYFDKIQDLANEKKYEEARICHDLFIDIVNEKKGILINNEEKTGYDALLSILVSPFGNGTISIADSTFNNNTAQFREIFKDGGLSRVGKDDLIDKLRVILTYYFFESMSEPEEVDEHLFMMLLPMQIGGSTWGVIGNIVKINPNSTYVDKNSWDQIYYLFQDIAIPIEKELRRKLLRLYIDDIFYKNYNFDDITTRKFKIPHNGLSLASAFTKIMTSTEADAIQLLENFNKVFDDLVKFYPFPRVELSIEKVKSDGNFLNGYNVSINTRNNEDTFDYEKGTRNHISEKLISDIDQLIKLESKQILNDLVTYKNLKTDNPSRKGT